MFKIQIDVNGVNSVAIDVANDVFPVWMKKIKQSELCPTYTALV